jgi:hypothetical protein
MVMALDSVFQTSALDLRDFVARLHQAESVRDDLIFRARTLYEEIT